MAEHDDAESPRPPGTPVGRRVFLGLLGTAAVGVFTGARIQDFLERTFGPVLAKDPTGIANLFPLGRFRYYTITGSFPEQSTKEYRLRVHGLVDQPLDLTYDDLLAMPATALTRDFQCVTGWRVHDVKWRGVKLADLIDRAVPQAGAAALRFTSFDGAYTESLTLAQLERDDVIVAYQLDGKAISRDHGGPVRLYVAPMYGYKSIKWLDGIELTKRVEPGYWEGYGYDVDAWIGRSNHRTDDPA